MSRSHAPLLRTLAEARSRVFQTTPPRPVGEVQNVRTGAKFLRKRLVGPSMLQYYPVSLDMKPFNKVFFGPGGQFEGQTWQAPDGSVRSGFIEDRELQRLKDVEHKKTMGKGPPKKGQGRRATMKGKGKR